MLGDSLNKSTTRYAHVNKTSNTQDRSDKRRQRLGGDPRLDTGNKGLCSTKPISSSIREERCGLILRRSPHKVASAMYKYAYTLTTMKRRRSNIKNLNAQKDSMVESLGLVHSRYRHDVYNKRRTGHRLSSEATSPTKRSKVISAIESKTHTQSETNKFPIGRRSSLPAWLSTTIETLSKNHPLRVLLPPCSPDAGTRGWSDVPATARAAPVSSARSEENMFAFNAPADLALVTTSSIIAYSPPASSTLVAGTKDPGQSFTSLSPITNCTLLQIFSRDLPRPWSILDHRLYFLT